MTNETNFDFNTYLVNHAEELKKFSKDVNILHASALTQLQRLPVSLRRRAASHNIKRLPHRFQKPPKVSIANKISKKYSVNAQLKDDLNKTKRCRKYRRRHLNLKDIYLKRQSKNKWLYTHIWHTKRFKVINKWGWRVPNEPTQKCFRPCTKAMKASCCMVDISYFTTIELCGRINKIISSLTPIMSNCNSESLNKRFKSGKQVSFVMHKAGAYPFDAICPCDIIRISNEQSYGSSVLLSFNPSAREEVITNLISVLSFHEIYPNCWVNKSKKIVMRDRSAELCRFRVMGQLSHNVVMSVLDSSAEVDALRSVNLSDVKPAYALHTSFSNLRSKRPALKQTDIPTIWSTQHLTLPPIQLGQSPFHSKQDILSAITEANITDMEDLLKFDLNQVKGEEECPIILSRLHYFDNHSAGGWDILLPAKWAMHMWTTLVLKGCRVSGLRYWTRNCALEMTSLTSKRDCYPLYGWPDTLQGRQESVFAHDSQLAAWKRRPPSKRINYIANGTTDPFVCPWTNILPDSTNNPSFYVMRDTSLLRNLVQQIIDGASLSMQDVDDICKKCGIIGSLHSQWRHSLIPVIIDCITSSIHNNALIMACHIDDNNDDDVTIIQSIHNNNNNQSTTSNRPIIGYVQIADQSMSTGKGRALAFVSLYQLLLLRNNTNNIPYKPFNTIWFKNTNTRQYCLGKLSISFN